MEKSRIQLCGRLSVELDGTELAGALRGRQVPLLLAYLVLNRQRPVGREELIGAMWPGTGPRSEDAAIRTLLSRLRSALGHQLVTGRDELVLALPEPAWVDVEAAAAGLARAQQALDGGDARAAWALAQVPLNIAGRGLLAGAVAPWLDAPRRELDDVRLRALEVIGRAGLVLGGTQLGSAERAARALIDAEPYRESGYVLLMDALGAQGNTAEALRVFERLRTLLRDELGTPPSAEALLTHERLLHPAAAPPSDSGTPATGPSTLPLPAELAVAASASLVGRATELAALARWWSSGDGERLLLLRGDPGVGKTRLLAELAGLVHAEGALVLAGRPPEETIVPYQPFVEALGQYVLGAPLDELRGVADDHGPELALLVVALRERLPELPASDRGNPDTERWRLFEAVAGLLERVAAQAPVPLLIVIDDLHWADRPTLLLLRHLLRSPRSHRLRIVAAYRATDRWSDGFEVALAGMHREQLARQLDIGGLAEPEAAALVMERSGGVASAQLTAALYRLTEGNPFFIKQILSHLDDAGQRAQDAGAAELEAAGLPDDVREVITRRLEHLAPTTVQWLRTAAVIGRDFESRLLERVINLDEERFLTAVDDALAAGLVTEARDGGGFSFSHQLIRETLYESMSGARRASIHHRIGVALEKLDGDGIGALALHFARGADPGDAERAIRYSLAAGARATEMLANEEAAGHYARALQTLRRVAPDDVRRQCNLLLDLGEARVRSGERRLAREALSEAAALAEQLKDGHAVARAAIAASRPYLQPPGIVDEQLIEMLERALELSSGDRTLTRVRLLNCLCGALYFSERRGRMEACSAEATQLAAGLEGPAVTAVAAAARRRANWAPATPQGLDGRLADSTLLLRAAREAGDAELTLQGHAWLVVDLLELGDRRAVEAQLESFSAIAEQLRQPLYMWNAGVWRAMVALLDGRLDDAETLAADAAAAGVRTESVTAPQYYSIQMLGVRREQDRMGELEPVLRQAVADNPGRPAWRAGLTTLLCVCGDENEARAQLRQLAAGRFDWTRDGDWIVAAVLAASAAADLGEREHAAALYELLVPYAASHAVVGIGATCLGSTSRPLGRLALVLGRRDAGIGHLRSALAANAALGAAVELAHTQVDLAAALGAGDEATNLLHDAQAAAGRMGWPWVGRRAERVRHR